MDQIKKVPEDEKFIIHVSEDMKLRNDLRTGLVAALQKDTDKVPMFVSWPSWLDDGIVCMYAEDLRQLLTETVQRVYDSVSGRDAGAEQPAGAPPEEAPGSFQTMNFGSLEHLEKSPEHIKSKPDHIKSKLEHFGESPEHIDEPPEQAAPEPVQFEQVQTEPESHPSDQDDENNDLPAGLGF